MLPKKYRLSNPELVRVKKEGKMKEAGGVAFLFLRVPELETKFGCVVSSRVSKKATERNRIKRKIREAVRQLLPEVRRGYQVLILARKAALKMEMVSLVKGLRKAFAGEGVIGEDD